MISERIGTSSYGLRTRRALNPNVYRGFDDFDAIEKNDDETNQEEEDSEEEDEESELEPVYADTSFLDKKSFFKHGPCHICRSMQFCFGSFENYKSIDQK